ncbi:MAG TPA: hypothetical protein VFW71_08560 [Actinomycetota bacterium]|nr:hypothetical protein [Actinomycetota bacterium]
MEERVPRRVRHLVVLPGGGGLDDLFSADSEAGSESGSESGGREAVAPTEVAERRGFRTFVPTKAVLEPVTAGALATQAVAEALPDAVPSSHNLKFKLRVITRSVTSPKAPGLPFIVFASILVSLAVLGMVFLRVMVDQASFKVDEVGTQVTQQQAQLTQLRYAVSVQEAPDHIAQRASQLGLVPAAKVQPLTPQTPTSTASGRANGA